MKKLIRKFMAKFGYDFIKTDRHTSRHAKQIKAVTIGNFLITMPGNNPLLSSYKYEPQLNFELGRLCKIITDKYPLTTIFDIGANVGDTIAIIKTFTDTPVIGIEGDAFTFSFLEKNITQFNNVSVYNKYLGEEKKNIPVILDKSGWNTTLIPSENFSTMIQLDTIDNLVVTNNQNSSSIKLIKVDTEGFDPSIIRGAKQTLLKNKPVVFLEYNRENMEAIGENGLDIFKFLSGYRYRRTLFFDYQGRFILATDINNTETISQLHYYAGGTSTAVCYFDICVFHEEDNDIADAFIMEELEHNKTMP